MKPFLRRKFLRNYVHKIRAEAGKERKDFYKRQHISFDRNTNMKSFYTQQKLECILGHKHDICSLF